MGKRTIVFLVFFYLSLFLRLTVFFLDPVMTRDSCAYIFAAEIVDQEGGFDLIESAMPDLTIPPLFLSLIVWLKHCGLSLATASIFLNIISGSIVPLIAGEIAYTISHDRKISLATLFLATIHPTLIELSGYGQRDMVYILMVGVLFLLMCLNLKSMKTILGICIGIALSIACLIRYESLEFIPIIFLFQIASKYTQRASWKKTLLNCAFLCISSVLVSLAYIHISGSGQYINKTYINYCNEKMDSVVKSYFL